MFAARLAEMHLIVDHTGHQKLTLSVDDLFPHHRLDGRVNLLDPLALDAYVQLLNLAFIHHAGIGNQPAAVR